MKSRNPMGFPVTELLIAMAIIGIIAAIAIPNLRASRHRANEAAAQNTLHAIYAMEFVYKNNAGNGHFGSLKDLADAQLIDGTIMLPYTKSGYQFNVVKTDKSTVPAGFYATAVPRVTSGIDQTGNRRFAVADDSVLRGDGDLSKPVDRATVEKMPEIRRIGCPWALVSNCN